MTKRKPPPKKNLSRRKSRKETPDVPSWMTASWKTAGRKPQNKLTMRDVDAIIARVRAERNSKNYKPVKLTITLLDADAAWLKELAAEQHCSIEELIMRAVWVYRHNHSNLMEDREYFTKAISESTEDFKTGRYEP